MALLRSLLDLLGRGGLLERLIGGIQLTVQLVHLLLESHELMASVFIFTQRDNGVGYFLGINLRDEIDRDHDRLSIKGSARLLIQDKHDPCCVSADFIFRDIHAVHDRDAFKIGRYLFQGISFGPFGGQANGVFSSVTVSHPMFTLGSHDSNLCQRN